MTRRPRLPRVLVACECSGAVRRAFRALGCDAWSCDILPAEDGSPHHLQGDVLSLLSLQTADRWDLMIAFPPCTYLATSGLHWNGRIVGRQSQTEAALRFVSALLTADVPRIALENPVGAISSFIRKPDQIINPWQFGHDASKRTCLWLKGLPLLRHTDVLEPTRFQANGRPRWGNQTATGQNAVGETSRRRADRARTYPGIAGAMAAQWAPLLSF